MEEQTQNFRQNTKFEILAATGFHHFAGITKRTAKSIKVITTGGEITVSETHKFFADRETTIIAKDLCCGDNLGEGGIVVEILPGEVIELYDPVEVENGNSYLANNFVHHNCQFLGSSNTLISGRSLATLSSIDPIFRNMNLDVYEEPQKGHQYVITVDVSRGIGGDYSAFTVIDVTDVPYRFVAKYRCNNIAPMLYPDIIFKAAKDYNDAFILVEINDIGGQVVDILHSDLEYENILGTVTENNKTYVSPGFAKSTARGVRTTKTVKRIGCFALKSLIEEQKLLIFDAETISELSTYIEKNGNFNADEGYNDDLVMSLVLFSWLTTNQYFKDITNEDIRKRMYENQMAQIADEMTPFGFVDDGRGEGEEVFIDDNVLWSTSKDIIPWKNTIS